MNFPPQVSQPIPTGSQQMSAVIPHSQIISQHGIRHTNQNQQAIQQAINSQRYSMQGQQMPQQVASPSYNLIIAQRQVPANSNPTLPSQFIPSAAGLSYAFDYIE